MGSHAARRSVGGRKGMIVEYPLNKANRIRLAGAFRRVPRDRGERQHRRSLDLGRVNLREERPDEVGPQVHRPPDLLAPEDLVAARDRVNERQREHDLVHLLFANQFLQPALRINRDAIWIVDAGKLGGIGPALDVGDLRGREGDDVVQVVVAVDDVEVMKVPAGRPHDDRLDTVHTCLVCPLARVRCVTGVRSPGESGRTPSRCRRA